MIASYYHITNGYTVILTISPLNDEQLSPFFETIPETICQTRPQHGTASPLQLKVILLTLEERSQRISSARSRRKMSVAFEESQAPLDRRMDLRISEMDLMCT